MPIPALTLYFQLGDKHRITTPVNWKKGDDVIIHPGVSDAEAKTLFPNYVTHKVRILCASWIIVLTVPCSLTFVPPPNPTNSQSIL